jgi:hypothetical protein
MSYISFFTSIGSTGSVVDNFPKNIPYSVESSYNPDIRYRFGFTMTKNPTNSLIIDLYRLGNDHFATDDGLIVFRKSTDNGQTWGVETTLLNSLPAKAASNFRAGYDSNGRLHILTMYTNSNDLDYFYSDDDGISLSSGTTIAQPDVNLTLYFPAVGEITFVNNILYAPIYGIANHGDFTESANYLMKSIDNGSNWTWTIVRDRDTAYINESSMVHLGGSNFLYVSRVEASAQFRFYYSSDNANTFSNNGNTNFGGALNGTHPALLRSFKIKNQQVVALYFFSRVDRLFYVIYAKGTDIVSSQDWSAFNLNTLTVLENYSTSPYALNTGYPTIQHPFNDLRGVFNYCGEISPSQGDRVAGILPTEGYNSLVSYLGL